MDFMVEAEATLNAPRRDELIEKLREQAKVALDFEAT